MEADDDLRTLWCGNLSERVTEDILYELFLQGGPIQRVSIPKDRDGRQRAFGFITFKHINSVPYAIELFDGTTLFNRPINIKARNISELPKIDKQPHELYNTNELLLLGHQMIVGNYPPSINVNMFNTNAPFNSIGSPSHLDAYSHQESQRFQRTLPSQRDHERNFNNDKKNIDDRSRDHRPYKRKINYRSSEYSRHDSYSSRRRNYH